MYFHTFVHFSPTGDLESDRKVSFEEGRNFAAQNNLIFLETSAKDGVGVDEVRSPDFLW